MKEKGIKKSLFSREEIVQITGLLFSIVFVGLIYSFLIRPQAEKVELNIKVKLAQDAGKGEYVPKRSVFIIVKNYEQQTCFTLFFWAMIIIIYKLSLVQGELKVMGKAFIEVEEGERIIPEEALSHAKHLESRILNNPGIGEKLLPKVVHTALRRFQSTHSVQDVSQAVRELAEAEAERLDSDLSLVRYIAWAIPSIGFIGTVRGIGEALNKAEEAIKGNIQGVTESLGLAFNSTLVALLLSIVLMYFIHLLQSRQESFILEVEEYCREKLIALMKIPFREESEFSHT